MNTPLSTLLLVSIGLNLLPVPAWSQGMAEMKGIGALSAGAGAGTAAALKKKNPKNEVHTGTTTALSEAGIEQMLQAGNKFEKAKNWAEAERCYRSGLTGLSNSGKFESPQRLALLDHISAVLLEQRKANEAVGYYRTVVALQQKRLGDSSPITITAKQHLADIFVSDGDLNNAATYLDQAVTSADKANPPLPSKQVVTLLDSYSTVLRELGRNKEAEGIDSRASTLRGDPATSKPSAANVIPGK